VAAEVLAFLGQKVRALRALGVADIIIDPGIGFGKTLEHNLELIRKLGCFKVLGCPIMLGVSRKSFIGTLSGGAPPLERLGGTIAACVLGALNGAVILRVHDVPQVKQALAVAFALSGAGRGALK
jgi:dihydropteroate synthase